MAHFTFDFYPKSLARKVDVDLVIPSLDLHGCLKNQDDQYYQNKKECYPLIIFLCGFGDNLKAWQYNTAIQSLCEKNKVAACFISGENKWYVNHGPIEDYDAFIERDLIDFLYGNFRNLSKEKPLIIAGVSMGGYGALRHYLQNTHKYSCCVALSPATKPDFLDEQKFGGTLRELFIENKNKPLNIYLAIGEQDFIIDASRDLNDFLTNEGIDASYRFVPDEAHTWNFWAKEIHEVFHYFKEKGFIS